MALLITNRYFRDSRLNRDGAEKDEENMEKLLQSLNYEVVKYKDLTAKVLLTKAKGFFLVRVDLDDAQSDV